MVEYATFLIAPNASHTIYYSESETSFRITNIGPGVLTVSVTIPSGGVRAVVMQKGTTCDYSGTEISLAADASGCAVVYST
jgi:hypothetical protein